MLTKIPKDFKPSERSYNNLRKHGAIPEFVDWELPNFIEYWMEQHEIAETLKAELRDLAGCSNADEGRRFELKKQAESQAKRSKKKSWQMTLQRWMRTAWEGKAGRQWERERHYRQDSGSDMFSFAPLVKVTRKEFEKMYPNTPREAADCVVATTGPEKREPPLDGKLGEVTGGREFEDKDVTETISSQSANRFRIIEGNKAQDGPPISQEQAFAKLRGILK